MPEGYLEARGGFQSIRASGGSTTDPISAGIYVGAHEHTMADGYIFTAGTGGTVFLANLAQRGYFEIWSSSAEAKHDALYVGADSKFSRVVLYIGQALVSGGAAQTFTYEYPKAAAWDTDGNAATSGTLTTTSTPTFTATGEQILEFAIPTDWVKAVRNGVYAWWVRIRLSDVGGGITTAARQGATAATSPNQKVYCDWTGTRQIYVGSANGAAATNNGLVKYYGQSSSTALSWQSVSTSLFSGNNPPYRFSSYKNLVYFVNGKEQKRWDNNTLADIGFTAPTSSGPSANVGGAGVLNGVFGYSVTYGYGPAGEWGESNELSLGSASPPTKNVVWTLNLTSIPAQAEVLYVYRTTDTTSVVETSSFPQFRIQTLYRDATGSFPTTVTDNTPDFPFPPVELNVATTAPPSRCKYVTTHKNRLFLGSNNQYPGRVWWSETFQAESFNTDENFADFTRSTGGQLTGMAEFNDQVIAWTEDQMFGIANLDQDIPSIFVISPGVGCVAPDSVAVGNGLLMWLGRNGAYVWDGDNPPKRVSDGLPITFGKLSYENHGGSRAVIHNRMYEVSFAKADRSDGSSTTLSYRYDLVTDSWAKVVTASSTYWMPIISATMPLAHADAGYRHPLYGAMKTGGTDYTLNVGEYTTQDSGSNFTCTVEVHFGPSGLREVTPQKAWAYYDGSSSTGWATPTLSNVNTSAYLGDTPGTLNNMTPDGGQDYSRLSGIYSEGTLGTGDLLVGFSAVTNGSGSANGQRLLSVGLEASGTDPLWGNS
jgi:hypothetical protein